MTDFRDETKRSRGVRDVLRGLAFGSALLQLGCSVSNTEPTDAGKPQDGNATGPDTSVLTPDSGATMLDRVAAIVVPNCATAGCHDAQTKEHGMDLSTGRKIYDAWVNQLGFDHCRNLGRTRVVPGSPQSSLIMTMITGAEICELSGRMPPPPRAALTADQIEVTRAWIGAGAPLGEVEAGVGDGGSDVADVSADKAKDVSTDAANEPSADVSIDPADDTADPGDATRSDATDEATNEDVTSDVDLDRGDAPSTDDADACNLAAPRRLRNRLVSVEPINSVCTATMPCSAGLICVGNSCAEEWQCILHAQGPGEHPCPPDNGPYCGCDGVTFMAPPSCADRPYIFQGACTDGVSCDGSVLPCEIPPPCPAGQAPSVVGGFYSLCVDIKWCRCDTSTHCPGQSTCNATTQRCGTPTRDQ